VSGCEASRARPRASGGGAARGSATGDERVAPTERSDESPAADEQPPPISAIRGTTRSARRPANQPDRRAATSSGSSRASRAAFRVSGRRAYSRSCQSATAATATRARSSPSRLRSVVRAWRPSALERRPDWPIRTGLAGLARRCRARPAKAATDKCRDTDGRRARDPQSCRRRDGPSRATTPSAITARQTAAGIARIAARGSHRDEVTAARPARAHQPISDRRRSTEHSGYETIRITARTRLDGQMDHAAAADETDRPTSVRQAGRVVWTLRAQRSRAMTGEAGRRDRRRPIRRSSIRIDPECRECPLWLATTGRRDLVRHRARRGPLRG